MELEPLTVSETINTTLATYDVKIDGFTVRPATKEGDAYFGLEPGTNGTASTMRRSLVVPNGFNWTRFDGSPATGLNYVPTNRSNFTLNPWSGR